MGSEGTLIDEEFPEWVSMGASVGPPHCRLAEAVAAS
jgi:hypothetical protein